MKLTATINLAPYQQFQLSSGTQNFKSMEAWLEEVILTALKAKGVEVISHANGIYITTIEE